MGEGGRELSSEECQFPDEKRSEMCRGLLGSVQPGRQAGGMQGPITRHRVVM